MKKYWFIGLLLVLTGCEEANEIFGDDEYFENYSPININGYEYYYDVYVDATSWGSVAYINDEYVNKGIKLLISEANDAEGGKVLDVTSNTIAINDLSPLSQYYYCLYNPDGDIKSNIMSVVVPDESALNLSVEQVGDSVICTILDSISSAFILEKGFKLYYSENRYSNSKEAKYVIEGERFAFSISDVVEAYSIGTGLFRTYAYVQTSNAYHRSKQELDVETNSVLPDSIKANNEEITFSEIFEKTIDDIDYLACTVTGYVDSVYFLKDWSDEAVNRIYPDKTETYNQDGPVTTYYVKKGFYKDVRLKAYYKYSYDGSYYHTYDAESGSYTPYEFNIRSLDEFLDFVSWDRYEWENYTISLLADITIPSDLRLCINLSHLTIYGNEHTLNGISYFPIFRDLYSSTIKDLKIGTNETVYHVKKGTSSLSTTNNEVPRYFLANDYVISNYITFENCEIRGTFTISDSNEFYVAYDYTYDWSEEEKAAATGNGYIERITGLKDYTKTEYVTTTND